MRRSWLLLLSVLVLGTACSVPAPFQRVVEPPGEQTGAGGIQWEADVAAHPPAPQNVEATVDRTGVRITWEQPFKVEVPHSYSDTIGHYRVFRRLASSADSVEIGTTDELFFVDSDPPAGLVFYHVTAIHEGGIESDRSDETDLVLGASD